MFKVLHFLAELTLSYVSYNVANLFLSVKKQTKYSDINKQTVS